MWLTDQKMGIKSGKMKEERRKLLEEYLKDYKTDE